MKLFKVILRQSFEVFIEKLQSVKYDNVKLISCFFDLFKFIYDQVTSQKV